MRDKPKTINVKRETKLIARAIFSTWEKAIKECRNQTKFFLPDALYSTTRPLNKGSVEARVCLWIEQNPTTGQKLFEEVVQKMYEGDVFLNHGYGILPPPPISWLFTIHRSGDWNINRFINGDLQFKGRYIPEGGI